MLALLRAEGAATVFVTHDPDEALRSADRIVLLRGGRIVQQGSPADLLDAPADIGAAAFFSPVSTFTAQVTGGVAATPLGAVMCGGRTDGAAVTVAFRPRDLALSEAGAGAGAEVTVTSADVASDGLHVTVAMADGAAVGCVLEPGARLHAGDVIRLAAKPGRGFVFDS